MRAIVRTCTQKIAKPNPIFCKDRESREKNGNLGPVFRTASYLRLCQRWGKVSDKPNLISISSPCAAKIHESFRIRSDRRSVEPARAASCKNHRFSESPEDRSAMPEIPFRPFRVLSDPGSDGQRHARTGYLPGPGDRKRNKFRTFVLHKDLSRKTRKTRPPYTASVRSSYDS